MLAKAGRFIHGATSEPLGVVRSTYNARYFNSALFYGLVLAMSRCGAVGGLIASPQIICSVFPLAPSCIAKSGDNSTEPNPVNGTVLPDGFDGDVDQYKSEIQSAIVKAMVVGIAIIAIGTLMMVALGIIDKREVKKMQKYTIGEQETSGGPSLSLATLKGISKEAWLIILIFMFFYCGVFPFNSFLPDYLKAFYGFSKETASTLSSVVYALSVIGAPLCGALLDKFRYHTVWLIAANVGLALSYGLWGGMSLFMKDQMFYPICLFLFCNGLFYSICAACLPLLLGMLVTEELQATAFGLLFGIQQIGIGLVSSLQGMFVDNYGFKYYPLFMSSVVCISCVFVLLFFMAKGFDPIPRERSMTIGEDDQDITRSIQIRRGSFYAPEAGVVLTSTLELDAKK